MGVTNAMSAAPHGVQNVNERTRTCSGVLGCGAFTPAKVFGTVNGGGVRYRPGDSGVFFSANYYSSTPYEHTRSVVDLAMDFTLGWDAEGQGSIRGQWGRLSTSIVGTSFGSYEQMTELDARITSHCIRVRGRMDLRRDGQVVAGDREIVFLSRF